MVLTHKTEFITVQNLSSWEEDKKAWDKPVYKAQLPRVLKFPNHPEHTDVYYDLPDLASTVAASPLRYHVMSSADDRFVSRLSLSAGDSRFLKRGNAYTADLVPGAYTRPESFEPEVDPPGTSSFHSPMRKYPPPNPPPDTSDANINLDKKEWERRGATVSRTARTTDPTLWRYGQSRVATARRDQRDLQYDVRTVLDGSPNSLFGQVCASPQSLRSSFASATKKAVALPVGRSSDMRLTRSVDNARAGQPLAKVWDGNNWVLPAQAARFADRLSRGGTPSMDLGRLKTPVSADGLHLFTSIRSGIKKGASMQGQGHFSGPKSTSMTLDSSLRTRR